MKARIGSATLVALLASTAGLAQSTGAVDTNAPAQIASPPGDKTVPATDNAGLQDIIVTAQKRSERLQDTPLAITAVGAAEIQERGISGLGDIATLAPGLTATLSTSSTSNLILYIRGIGNTDPVLTADSPVSVYVDGIALGRQNGSAFDIVDLDRIEVLRGPQGTLYGRNTIGGAVNLITKKPTEKFGLTERISYGNFNAFQTKTRLDTGDIGDTGIAAAFTYLHKQRNGYIDDITAPDSEDPAAYRIDAYRAALRYDHGGPFTADYSFDYNDSRSYSQFFQLTIVSPAVADFLSQSPLFGGSTALVSPTRQDPVRGDPNGLIRDRTLGHTLTLQYDLGGVTLRSLTGYRYWHNDVAKDSLDGNGDLVGFLVSPEILTDGKFVPLGVQPYDLFTASARRRQHQFSQEFNILGDIGSHFKYVLGAYYFDEHAGENNPQNYVVVVPSPFPIPIPGVGSINSFGIPLLNPFQYSTISSSKAGFAQATYTFTDKISLTGGIRYTSDQKSLDQQGPFMRQLDRSFHKFNYAASADYKISPDVLVYARTSSGYKAGGFNPRASNDGYNPETLTSYETGIKSEFFDHRLRFNGTVYYATHDNVQLTQFQAGTGGASSVTVNAGKARYWGIEGELSALIARGLNVYTNVGYVNRKYLEFLILDPATNQLVDVANTAKFTIGATTTVTAGFQYTAPRIPLGVPSLRLDFDYRGKIYFNPTTVGTPFNEQTSSGPRALLNGRLALSDIALGSHTAEVALFAKNINNKIYRLYGIDFGGLGFAGDTYSEPRTFGIELNAAF